MFYLLPFSQTVPLTTPFQTDGIVLYQTSTLNLQPLAGVQDNTSLDVLNAGGDTLLHISFRRFANEVVFNARTAGGAWGAEEKIPLVASFVGPSNSITVYDHGDRYQILFNYNTVHYFTKRIAGSGTSISYGSNAPGQTPFSDPLAVYAYSSLAGLASGDN